MTAFAVVLTAGRPCQATRLMALRLIVCSALLAYDGVVDLSAAVATVRATVAATDVRRKMHVVRGMPMPQPMMGVPVVSVMPVVSMAEMGVPVVGVLVVGVLVVVPAPVMEMPVVGVPLMSMSMEVVMLLLAAAVVPLPTHCAVGVLHCGCSLLSIGHVASRQPIAGCDCPPRRHVDWTAAAGQMARQPHRRQRWQQPSKTGVAAAAPCCCRHRQGHARPRYHPCHANSAAAMRVARAAATAAAGRR